MIRRVVGWLFAIVTIAVVVFALLNMGNYETMCKCFSWSDSAATSRSENSVQTAAEAVDEPVIDTLGGDVVIVPDSGVDE